MMMDRLPDFIEFLLKPASYPHGAGDVHLIQTHISYVLLAGDFVYKFKKPMNFGFLNFTTLEKRKFFCEQELLLNRRLCPTVYLDLVTINRDGAGGLTLNGPGEVVEYGVKMTRMPEERMMNNIIRAGKLNHRMIEAIVATLKPFYEKAASGPTIEKFSNARAVETRTLENLQQSEPYLGCESLSREEYKAIDNYVRNFLKNKELFSQRVAAGRIRDCHGDLHSANICLADRVYIYDCIEFNHRFRYIDMASDVAFLAVDLDYYGLEELSEYFIHCFQEATEDLEISAVLNFYKCYRAAVRGKIGLLTGHEPEVDPETRAKGLAQATRYFALAQRYAETG
jgi:aminoglycoside phosphotransferase family enzyme